MRACFSQVFEDILFRCEGGACKLVIVSLEGNMVVEFRLEQINPLAMEFFSVLVHALDGAHEL